MRLLNFSLTAARKALRDAGVEEIADAGYRRRVWEAMQFCVEAPSYEEVQLRAQTLMNLFLEITNWNNDKAWGIYLEAPIYLAAAMTQKANLVDRTSIFTEFHAYPGWPGYAVQAPATKARLVRLTAQ